MIACEAQVENICLKKVKRYLFHKWRDDRQSCIESTLINYNWELERLRASQKCTCEKQNCLERIPGKYIAKIGKLVERNSKSVQKSVRSSASKPELKKGLLSMLNPYILLPLLALPWI